MVVLDCDARHLCADIDIVIARRVRGTDVAAYGNVPTAGRHVNQRIITDGCVPVAVGGEGAKRFSPDGRVGAAGCVVKERVATDCSVAVARCAGDRGIVEEGLKTNGCIIEARYVMKKCL